MGTLLLLFRFDAAVPEKFHLEKSLTRPRVLCTKHRPVKEWDYQLGVASWVVLTFSFEGVGLAPAVLKMDIRSQTEACNEPRTERKECNQDSDGPEMHSDHSGSLLQAYNDLSIEGQEYHQDIDEPQMHNVYSGSLIEACIELGIERQKCHQDSYGPEMHSDHSGSRIQAYNELCTEEQECHQNRDEPEMHSDHSGSLIQAYNELCTEEQECHQDRNGPEMHSDHTYSSACHELEDDIPYSALSPSTVMLTKKIRRLHRKAQRQKHKIKAMKRLIKQLHCRSCS